MKESPTVTRYYITPRGERLLAWVLALLLFVIAPMLVSVIDHVLK